MAIKQRINFAAWRLDQDAAVVYANCETRIRGHKDGRCTVRRLAFYLIMQGRRRIRIEGGSGTEQLLRAAIFWSEGNEENPKTKGHWKVIPSVQTMNASAMTSLTVENSEDG